MGKTRKSKFKKIIIISLSVILFLSLSSCIYRLFLVQGHIPYGFQEKTMKLYIKSHLSKIFGVHVKLVLDYPGKLYYCKNDLLEFTRNFPRQYQLKYNLQNGQIFDDDYNLLFTSGSSYYINELEDLNRSNFLSEDEYIRNIKVDDIKEKIENMIILKSGSRWYTDNFGELSIKLYNDGEFVLSYAWFDEESLKSYDYKKYKKKRYIRKVPVKKELVKRFMNQIDFASFEKFRCYDTFWDQWTEKSSSSGIMIKKGEKIKIIYRGATIEKELKEFRERIINLGKIKEFITNEMSKEEVAFIGKERLEIFFIFLSY